jgi:hypothetical protein
MDFSFRGHRPVERSEVTPELEHQFPKKNCKELTGQHTRTQMSGNPTNRDLGGCDPAWVILSAGIPQSTARKLMGKQNPSARRFQLDRFG